jgi:hypothetical protein
MTLAMGRHEGATHDAVAPAERALGGRWNDGLVPAHHVMRA